MRLPPKDGEQQCGNPKSRFPFSVKITTASHYLAGAVGALDSRIAVWADASLHQWFADGPATECTSMKHGV
jgi:hypothetical protein